MLNLSSRKRDFQALITNLSNIFLESTDQTVLKNCCMAIVSLAKGEHARSNEALLRLKEMAGSLRDRLLELLDEKSKQKDDGSDDEDEASGGDLDQSINLCLRRLKILSLRGFVAELLSEAADDTIDDAELGNLCSAVTKYIGNELKIRENTVPEDVPQDGSGIEVARIWETADEDIHAVVADSVSEGLDFLLTTVCWRLNKEIDAIEESDGMKEYSDDEIKNHVVIQLRDWISKLIILCYEHWVNPNISEFISKENLEFSEAVQSHGVRATGDLRSLFLRDWRKAKSPFLQACALPDGILIGAGVRFVRSQEYKIREAKEGSDEKRRGIEANLLPVARGLCTNWEFGNRREAGTALAHIAGSGKEAHDVALAISRVLKKIQPVRLLEAHMACLRQDYEEWAESEPEELGDRPTDAEMAEYDEATAAHKERVSVFYLYRTMKRIVYGVLSHPVFIQFEFIQSQASKLASSLGVAKIRDERLARALLGFVREGIRFAFSTEEDGSDEDLPLGCRLPFLRILTK